MWYCCVTCEVNSFLAVVDAVIYMLSSAVKRCHMLVLSYVMDIYLVSIKINDNPTNLTVPCLD